MKRLTTAAAVVLVALAAGACGPRLVVRHEDPYHPKAIVWVDGAKQGTLEHGDKMRVRLERGRHVVRVTLPGEKVGPWFAPRDEVSFVLDRKAVLRLLPMPASPSP